MLKKILENKTKTRLLVFFLVNPERSFYSQELKRRVGGKSLDLDLGGLVKMGVLSSFVKKGNKYYRVNKKHPLYMQLKGPAVKAAKGYEDELVKVLKKIPGLKLAVLSGVFTSNPKMECDMLLVGNIPQKQVDSFVYGLEKMVGQEVNYAVLNQKEFEYRNNIFDRFMKDVFENDHLVVVDKIR